MTQINTQDQFGRKFIWTIAIRSGVLFLLLVLVEATADHLLPQLFVVTTKFARAVADATVLFLVGFPCIWFFILKPVRIAESIGTRRLELMFDQMVDAVLLLDADDIVVACNPAAERLFVATAGELIGSRIDTLIRSTEGNNYFLNEQLTKNYGASSVWRLDCSALCRDGSSKSLSYTKSSAELHGSLLTVMVIRNISDWFTADKALRQSEARFRSLADFSPVGIFQTDSEGNCLFVNNTWCRLAGLSPEAALGRGWLKALHPDDAERIAREWYEAAEAESQFSSVYRFQAPSGTETWISGSAAPIKDEQGNRIGYIGVIQDISEQRKSEIALQESEERFRSIYHQTDDAIYLLVPGECSVLSLNSTAESLFGYTIEDLATTCISLFPTFEAYHSFSHAVCMLEEGKSIQLEKMQVVRKDGVSLFVSIHAKMIRLQGDSAIYCTFRDITQRLRMEEEARSIQSQLIYTNKMTSLGLLVAGIAHEINNPNNYILANAEMLQRISGDIQPLLRDEYERRGEFSLGGLPCSTLQKTLPEMVAAIRSGSDRINRIVSDLKGYVRRGADEKERLDLNAVITSAMVLLKHHISKHTEHFTLQLADPLPPVIGSSQQLEQVVINLVMNGLEALSSKQQKMRLETTCSHEAGTVCMTVTDEGCGMTPEVQAHILEPFFTTRMDLGGTGLGLSITSSIVHNHGGTVEINSKPGRGTEVRICLPFFPQEQPETYTEQ